MKEKDKSVPVFLDPERETRSGLPEAVFAQGKTPEQTAAIARALFEDTPSRGDIFLDGKEITSMNEEQRANMRGEMVGFVFQSFQLLGSLTALENVMLPAELSGEPNALANATPTMLRSETAGDSSSRHTSSRRRLASAGR